MYGRVALWVQSANLSEPNEFMACPDNRTLRGCDFTDFLTTQLPVYDELILMDIRPTDGWILHVDTGTFEAYSGVAHTLDRFNHVWPNVTKQWTNTTSGNCLGTPCDKVEHYITWGSTRLVYFLEEQSWATQLICFDNDMHITKAREQFQQIISDILRPATSAIWSNYLRKRVAQYAGTQLVANATMSAFTYSWVVVGNEEIFIDATQLPTSKLTPQMLQRQVVPLMQVGYFGKTPFKNRPPMIELVTGIDTAWELDHLGGQQGVGGVPSIAGNWRFTVWDAVSQYWAYGFNGSIGNYTVRVDPFQLRFNFTGIYSGLFRFQVVLPYVNVASSGAGTAPGLKDIVNPSYDLAPYCWSYIWHPKALQVLVAQDSPINPEMPFAHRDFGGKWQFVMNNLGDDNNGRAIENKRMNKGQFIADFKQAARPQYTELSMLLFHKREPQCIIVIAPCTTDPGYPAQVYNSAPVDCTGAIITPN